MGALNDICETLKKEALEPAEKESKQLVLAAKERAQAIVEAAEKEAKKLLLQTQNQIKRDEKIFQLSLKQAAEQSLESLRQEIEAKFFSQNLQKVLEEKNPPTSLFALLIEALISTLEKEGSQGNFTLEISQKISKQELIQALHTKAKQELKKESISLGNFRGGIRLSLKEEHLCIDASTEALAELLQKYLRREDFRQFFFFKQ